MSDTENGNDSAFENDAQNWYQAQDVQLVSRSARLLELSFTISSEGFAPKPGQFVQLGFHSESAGDFPLRAYSLAGIDGKRCIIHIGCSRQGPGEVTGYIFGALRDELRDGAVRIDVYGPFGEAYYREGARRPCVAVAGGYGIAQLRTIVHAALADPLMPHMAMFWGARRPENLYLLDELQDLVAAHPDRLSLYLALEEAGDGNGGPPIPDGAHIGYVSDILREQIDDFSRMDIYLCGPHIMIKNTLPVITGKDSVRSRIYFDPVV